MSDNVTLAELVTLLAGRRAALAVMQDEAERIQQQCEALEVECGALLVTISEAAIATGERKPHPAVTVQAKCEARIGYIPVKIKDDLSLYRWCAGCNLTLNECEGVPGIDCLDHPRNQETSDDPRHAEAYEKAQCGSG